MTISSAIAALSPSIWYKLDESGATAVNSGSQSNNGTYSGSYDQLEPGPEEGTFATRLYVGGQVLSGVMDLTTFVSQSMGLWVSTDASGLINTPYPVMSIGDPANRSARGPRIWDSHSNIGIPSWSTAWQNFSTTAAATPQPIRFWHWVVATYAAGTSNIRVYVDGQPGTFTTLGTVTALLATDRLLIRSDQPVVVSHACWFGGVLTQTQIQSVSNELATWPYSQPINTPPPNPTGGSGGLTEDQAAQLGRIEGYTDDIPGLVDASTYIAGKVNTIEGKVDIVNAKLDHVLANWVGYSEVTLPILTSYIEQIIDSVTATVTQLSGDVPVSVGRILSQPPFQLFVNEDLSGGVKCEHLEHDLSGGRYYGVVLNIASYPEDWKWRTPDRAWSLRDLAVIRIIRGGNLIQRQGIHTLSHTLSPLPESLPFGLGRFELEVQPDDYHVTVDFAEGVCGRLEGLTLP